MSFTLQQIDHVAINVLDLKRSAEWYQRVLGLEPRFQDTWTAPPLGLGVGSTWLALFPAECNVGIRSSNSEAGRLRHLAFKVDRANFLAAQSKLRQEGIEFAFEDHGIAHSIYFLDPDGHTLELTTYELTAHC